MASKTDIANIAVRLHQGDWLQNVDSDPGNFADALRATWQTTLDVAMSQHEWNFARWSWRDVPSVPGEQNPDPERAFFYPTPADCVRVFRLPSGGGDGFDFTEWQGGLASDEGPRVTMIGVQKGVDIGKWSPMFNEYLGSLWGLSICTAVNASEAIRKRCQMEKATTLADARSDSSKVGTTPRKAPDSFVGARLSGGRYWAR